jgi:class 3 adenylate cyclase
MLFNQGIRRHLLSDVWRVGTRLAASKRLRAEVKKGFDPLTLLEVVDELAEAVQRFELISRVRESIHLIPSIMSEAQIQETYRAVRLYHFTESVETTGNAVNATVMFLDLRGFTETSEGLVSERDLTRQLYTVFDPFIELIARFGGEVDKFLGDGMMVTFGAVHSSPYGPINAVRTAILLQERIRRLRDEGKTHFTMGISIHFGRVYLAHFIGSAGGQDTTVIGRNVNVAGRLSSAAKGEIQEEEAPKPQARKKAGSQVEVDERGDLFNEGGIAISREAVQALEKVMPLTRQDEVEDLYGELYDPTIEKKVRIRYAGDAKFKGVRSSFPVYSVEYGAVRKDSTT